MIAKWGREGLDEAAKVGRGLWNRERALSWIADRREDSLRLDGGGPPNADLVIARIALYKAQTKGAEIRNDLAMASLCFRDKATDAFSSAASEQIAAGDAWSRDHQSPACSTLARQVGPAQVLAIKAELWNELRELQSRSIERIAGTLAAGEDVGPASIRLSRRVG